LFRIGGNLTANTTAPYQYSWNTRGTPNGTYTIEAEAHDFAGLHSSAFISVSTANDFSGPSLSSINTNPSVPQYNQNVVVYVAAVDQSGVQSVILHHRTGSGLWSVTPMIHSGAIYEATLGSDTYGTRVDYYIMATDIYGSTSTAGSEIAPFYYIVGDTTNPTISVSGPSTDAALRGTVSFMIGANDGIGGSSGLAEFEFLIDGILTNSSSTIPSNFTWDTTSILNGYHTLTFRVVDNAGNPASIALTCYVANGVIDFGPIMSAYGFFIGAGGTIAAIIVVSILLKRRTAR
jgi:Bacterial Ig domain